MKTLKTLRFNPEEVEALGAILRDYIEVKEDLDMPEVFLIERLISIINA